MAVQLAEEIWRGMRKLPWLIQGWGGVGLLLLFSPYRLYLGSGYLMTTVVAGLVYRLRVKKIAGQIDRQLTRYGHSVRLLPREDVGKGMQKGVAFWNPAIDRIPAVNLFANVPILKTLKLRQTQHIAWHMAGNSQQVAFYLTASWQGTVQTLLHQLAATWPGLQSVPCAAVQAPLGNQMGMQTESHAYTICLAPREWQLPLTTTTSEPLTALLLRLGELAPQRYAGITLLLRPAPKQIRQMIRVAIREYETTKQREQTKRLKQRLEGAWFEAIIQIHAQAKTAKQARSLAEQLAADLRAAVNPDNPLLVVKRLKKPATLSWQKRYSTPLYQTDVALLAHLVGRAATEQAVPLQTAAAVVCYPTEACYVSRQALFYKGKLQLLE
ncbi:MAG TPA: hypothetical protein ENJ56_02870 [Anaerolineae bacterium]|nr:hypothetical protein [Anaerolineae bacterium]